MLVRTTWYWLENTVAGHLCVVFKCLLIWCYFYSYSELLWFQCFFSGKNCEALASSPYTMYNCTCMESCCSKIDRRESFLPLSVSGNFQSNFLYLSVNVLIFWGRFLHVLSFPWAYGILCKQWCLTTPAHLILENDPHSGQLIFMPVNKLVSATAIFWAL